MPDPFFSIIVPVYNRSALIGKTIRSLLAQSFTSYEIIVVDDGSTDDTYSVVKAIECSFLKVYTKANGERGAARNFGARHARGRYLIFFDSDDIMYAQHLSGVHDFLAVSNLPPVVYTGFEYINTDGKVLKKIFINDRHFKKKLVFDNFLGCNSVVIRADVFKEFWFNESRAITTSEDRELWLRVAAVYPFHFIPVISFAMVEHEGRSLRSLDPARIDRIKKTLIASLDKDRNFRQGFAEWYRFLYAYELSLLISVWANSGEKKKAYNYLVQAFKLYPAIVFSKRFIAGLKNLLFRL